MHLILLAACLVEPPAERVTAAPRVDTPTVEVTACVPSIAIVSPSEPVAASSTTHVDGRVQSCGAPARVSVLLDGEDLASFACEAVDPTPTIDGDAWSVTANLFCLERALGVSLQDVHTLEAILVTDAGELARASTTITFSATAGASAELPWIPGVPSPVGSEPKNTTGAVVHLEYTVQVPLDGADRTYGYAVDVPPGYDPSVPAPVILAFTGWGSDTYWQRFAGEGTALAAEIGAPLGALVVTPNGNWWDTEHSEYADPDPIGSYGGCLEYGGYRQCEILEGNNWYTPVLVAVTEDLVARYSIDPSRVHAAGFSCGGGYAFCVGMAWPSQIAGVVLMDATGVTPAVLDGPYTYGVYVPDGLTRSPPIFVSGSHFNDGWMDVLGPGGTAAEAWCLDPATALTYDSGDHRWYPEANEAIAAWLAPLTIDP